MIKNIVFDVGGVLVRIRPGEAFSDLGFDREKADAVVKATLGASSWRELDRGVMSKEAVIAWLKNGLDEETKKNVDLFFEKAVWHFVEPFPYSRKWLSSLRERGFRVFLLSNYPDWLWEANEKDVFDFIDCIDGKVVSGFEKVIKPDPRIYNLLLSRYSLKAEECVFLDDMNVNVEAAKKEGFAGIHFTSYEKALSELEDLLKG